MGSRSRYGRENHVMVDFLISANRIRTRLVKRVFCAVDRGDYVTPAGRSVAYLQQPWRRGALHLSAPGIYGEALEALEMKSGQSFLNVGSGTGYFSTVVGLIIGCSGVNHGVEVSSNAVDFANERIERFIENSPALDEFDFCIPKFHCGNGLCLGVLQQPYDRVYCGAECPAEYLPYFRRLIKIGGLLVLPVENRLLQIKRESVDVWTTKSLLHISFSMLQLPTSEETAKLFTLEMPCPQRLQILSYAVVRKCLRASPQSRRPPILEPLLRCPRLSDVAVNELLRHIFTMDQNIQNPLGVFGLTVEKEENVCDINGDHTNSLVFRKEVLKARAKSIFALNNNTDGQSMKEKNGNIKDADQTLEKRERVHANVSPSQSVSRLIPTSRSLEETNQCAFSSIKQSSNAVETNKESENMNRMLKPYSLLSGFPNFQLLPSNSLEKTNKSELTLKNDAKTSSDTKESVDITETNKNVEEIIGGEDEVLANKVPSLFHFSEKSTSDCLKESNNGLTAKNDSNAFENREKSVTVIEANKELEKSQEIANEHSIKSSFFDLLSKTESAGEKTINNTIEHKGVETTTRIEEHTSNFLTTPQNLQLHFANSDKYLKNITELPQVTGAADNKTQLAYTGLNWLATKTSPVFTFKGIKRDLASVSKPSPLKSATVAEAVSTNERVIYNVKETIAESVSVSSHPAAAPVSAAQPNLQSDSVGRDMQLSIYMKQGIMEVSLPYEQKESTNIIFTKINTKAMSASEDPSSQFTTGERNTTLEESQEHMSDAFVRLALSPIPLKKVISPATVAVSFRTLIYYTDWIWDIMMTTKTQSFDNKLNKAIFQKGALLLAEAKIAYAQRTVSEMPEEVLTSRTAFTNDELENLNQMASKIPLPLAIYLECLGNTNKGDQKIIPILAGNLEYSVLSGAPRQMLSLLQLLRRGVYSRIQGLFLDLGLPMLDWEEFLDTTSLNKHELPKVRITEESYNFWITSHNGNPAIKWDSDEHAIFKQIVSSLDSRNGFNVDLDLSHGRGSQAQFVETIDYKVDRSTQWFTRLSIDDDAIKLGAAFAFRACKDDKCKIPPPAAYMRGEIIPRRIIFAILSSVNKNSS